MPPVPVGRAGPPSRWVLPQPARSSICSPGKPTISIPTAHLWRAFPAFMKDPKESTPKFPVSLPDASSGSANSIVLSYKSHQADTWHVWVHENGALMVYMSTGVFPRTPYVSRYPAVGQGSKTQLEPPLQCCWHPVMLQSCVPSPLPAAPSVTKPAALLSALPATGLCSSLSAHAQEYRDNCWDIYKYIYI